MNICTVFSSSAFNGLLCYKSPTSATLDRYLPYQDDTSEMLIEPILPDGKDGDE